MGATIACVGLCAWLIATKICGDAVGGHVVDQSIAIKVGSQPSDVAACRLGGVGASVATNPHRTTATRLVLLEVCDGGVAGAGVHQCAALVHVLAVSVPHVAILCYQEVLHGSVEPLNERASVNWIGAAHDVRRGIGVGAVGGADVSRAIAHKHLVDAVSTHAQAAVLDSIIAIEHRLAIGTTGEPHGGLNVNPHIKVETLTLRGPIGKRHVGFAHSHSLDHGGIVVGACTGCHHIAVGRVATGGSAVAGGHATLLRRKGDFGAHKHVDGLGQVGDHTLARICVVPIPEGHHEVATPAVGAVIGIRISKPYHAPGIKLAGAHFAPATPIRVGNMINGLAVGTDVGELAKHAILIANVHYRTFSALHSVDKLSGFAIRKRIDVIHVINARAIGHVGHH